MKNFLKRLLSEKVVKTSGEILVEATVYGLRHVVLPATTYVASRFLEEAIWDRIHNSKRIGFNLKDPTK